MEKEIKIVIQFEPIFDTTNKSGHTIALIHKYNFGGHFTMEIPYTLPGNPKKIWESSRNSLNKKFQESQNLANVPSAALFYKILVMVLKNSLKSAKKCYRFRRTQLKDIAMLRPPRARPCHELLIKRLKIMPF